MPYKDKTQRNKATYNSWKRHPERRATVQAQQDRRRQEKGYWVDHNLRRYGLSLEDYAWMWYTQDGKCKICSKSPIRGLVVDHDHATGKVRGLLCGPCNSFLGFLENQEWKKAAEEYLDQN